jgi:hypothetical protein
MLIPACEILARLLHVALGFPQVTSTEICSPSLARWLVSAVLFRLTRVSVLHTLLEQAKSYVFLGQLRCGGLKFQPIGGVF